MKVLHLEQPGNFGRAIHKKRILERPERYMGGEGLSNMFVNEEIRMRYSVEVSQPTDPQAEIIFLENLPAKLINKVILPAEQDYVTQETVTKILREIPKGTIVESQNRKQFSVIDWKDRRRVKEFHERKWSNDWN
jgi:hypothetical protein